MDCAIYRKKSQRSVFIIVLNNVQLMMKNALELTRRNLFTKWLKNLLQLNQTVSYSEALPLHENETFSFHFSNFFLFDNEIINSETSFFTQHSFIYLIRLHLLFFSIR